MKIMKKIMLYLILLAIMACSPKTVNKVYLSDSEMLLSIKKCEKMELNFMLYREGSSGANGGKAGGGCGCN